MSMLNMNRELFEEKIKGDKPVLVEFWAPWCVYCRRIAPALTKVAQEYDGKIEIGQVNIDEEPGIAEKEKIEVIPTFVIYKDGARMGSIIAPDSKAKIEDFIEGNLK